MDDLLPTLRPPPDGLPKLRARLEARRRPSLWWLLLPATMVLVALLTPRTQGPALGVDPVHLGADAPPISVLPGSESSVALFAVAETEDVVFFRVSAFPQGQ